MFHTIGYLKKKLYTLSDMHDTFTHTKPANHRGHQLQDYTELIA
jgi:hypothetical protein